MDEDFYEISHLFFVDLAAIVCIDVSKDLIKFLVIRHVKLSHRVVLLVIDQKHFAFLFVQQPTSVLIISVPNLLDLRRQFKWIDSITLNDIYDVAIRVILDIHPSDHFVGGLVGKLKKSA